ncbi:MAG: HDOD domain-containing protein [Candidatus Electryonea clarkiae]|nr:HDOD domain-containing protein [Candidatus Electryonea clarkiae]MDP8285639.1 HDOD domain-containing protein [Candidatus Electryonea clarkiae]
MTDSKSYARKLVESTEQLPSPDPIVIRVSQLVSDPDTAPKYLAAEIYKDAGLTSRILKLSNSALFGLSRQIVTIEQAVVVLGFNEIRNLVMLTSTLRLMNLGRDEELFKLLWDHFLLTAIAARSIARRVSGDLPGIREYSYLGGLLHDIGKVILALRFTKAYRKLVDRDDILIGNIVEEETTLFGCNHLETGECLLEHWNFPPILVNIAGYHHNIEDKDTRGVNFLKIIWLADALSNFIGHKDVEVAGHKEMLRNTRIHEETWNNIIIEVRDRFELEKEAF